jgi:hypothetical protein
MLGAFGLQTNLTTWLIMAGVTALWIASLRLIPGWREEGWTSVVKSLYGLVWLGFGLDILLRFSMLSYNAVEWGNGTLRLVAIDASRVNTALAYCGVYWLLVSLGFSLAARRGSSGPLGVAQTFTPEFAYAIAIPTAVLCSVAFYFTEGFGDLPLEILTPVALIANLYMVPAAMVWWDHFRRPGPKWRVGAVQLIVLMPAVVRAWRSPYRENLAPIVLIPLIAALCAGKRPALRKLLPASLACLFIMSAIIGTYRRVRAGDVRAEDLGTEMREAGVGDWIAGTWDEPMHRFHGFDSMLLTVALVPAMEPYSGRSVLTSPFVRGIIPRFIYAGKDPAVEGFRFGERIWAFDDPLSRARRVGSIAPSMPGDLYDAGGLLFIALGGLIWGIVLGMVDGWKDHLPGFCRAAIISLVATQCLMSVERDFDHTVATFIQTLIVFLIAAGLVALSRRGSPQFALSLRERAEGS